MLCCQGQPGHKMIDLIFDFICKKKIINLNKKVEISKDKPFENLSCLIFLFGKIEQYVLIQV